MRVVIVGDKDGVNVADQLERLSALHADGRVTDDEYRGPGDGHRHRP